MSDKSLTPEDFPPEWIARFWSKVDRSGECCDLHVRQAIQQAQQGGPGVIFTHHIGDTSVQFVWFEIAKTY